MSSIDWLGKVNPSWGYAPLFTLGDPKKKPNKGMLESNLLSLSYGRIIRRNIESSDGLVPASYETYQIVEPGDTVLRFTDLQNDQRSLRSGLVEERGIITSAYLSFTPDRRSLNPSFFAHMMRAVDLSKVFYRMGSGVRQSLNWGEFSLMRLPLPPLETQQRIADYLDRETADIDAAVADLDRYMELLEKRKWQQLNEILENSLHSRVRLSVAAKMKTGTTPSTLLENQEGVPWLKPDGLGVQSTGQRIDFEMLGESLLSPGGTTYVCGIGATIGKVGYSEEPSITNQQITALTPVLNIIPKLFYYSVLTLTDWLRRTAPGSTLPILNNTRLGTYSVRIPVLDVQQTVLAEIESLFHETDQIIAESTTLRDLLLKRRSILITEVVTGRKQV